MSKQARRVLSVESRKKALVNWAQRNQYCPFLVNQRKTPGATWALTMTLQILHQIFNNSVFRVVNSKVNILALFKIDQGASGFMNEKSHIENS